MDATALILYCVTILSVAIVPGPSMALAFAHGSRYGVLGTVPTALGNVAASLAQAGVAFIALKTASAIDPRIFAITQAVGALVLLYIGVSLIRTALRTPITAETPADSASGRQHRFLTGIVITLFNPKAVLFFVALFPQFVDHGPTSAGALGAIFVPIALGALISFLLYAGLGTLSSALFGRSRAPRVLLVAVGSIVSATGLAGLLDALHDLITDAKPPEAALPTSS